MSTIKSKTFSKIMFGTKDEKTGLYNVVLPAAIITEEVVESGTVLVGFRQSDVGSGWMTIPFALPNDYWAFGYGEGAITISNTGGGYATGTDFKVIAVSV